ncbi:MAG: UDP-4-amino-4,6-dideoxy-N-acetyl-beta-L-altrosamine N-acetyltransferase [Desulfopila sp.]
MDFGILRDISPVELELMRAWRNSPDIRANMYTRHVISQQEHIEWWNKTAVREDQQYFMYEFNGKPTGIVSFNGIDKVNRNSRWAFYAAPTAEKGTGSRMEFLALNYAFDELKLHKLCCEVLEFNAAVVKLHQKFGFRIEGVLKEQHIVENKYVDIYCMGILASEWIGFRVSIENRLKSFVR